VTLSVIDLQRTRKAVEGFCTRRSRGQMRRLACHTEGNDILIVETSLRGGGRLHGKRLRALVRLRYANPGWRVFWPRDNGMWEPYQPLPFTESIQDVIDELEQAPLHVHWG
jgi:hypothetical protein